MSEAGAPHAVVSTLDVPDVIEGNSSQRQHHPYPTQPFPFKLQVGPTIPDLLQVGLVGRWSAVDDGSDVAVH